jgi:predicted secreted protein
MKKLKNTIIAISLFASAAAIASTPAVKTHLIKPINLMPGPVIVNPHKLPVKGIGPVAVTQTQNVTLSKANPKGSVFLPVNPSTGAHWELYSHDGQLINVSKGKYLGPTSEIFGAPGHWSCHYKATAKELNSKQPTQIVFALVAADGHIIEKEVVNISVS